MAHRYRITIESLDTLENRLQFESETHDDLFEVIAAVRQKNLLPSEEVPEFCIGLKLLGATVLRHRQLALFQPLFDTFKSFMKQLKAS